MNNEQRIKHSGEALEVLRSHAAYLPAFMGEATIKEVDAFGEVTLTDVALSPVGDIGFGVEPTNDLAQYVGKDIKIVVQVAPEGGFKATIRGDEMIGEES